MEGRTLVLEDGSKVTLGEKVGIGAFGVVFEGEKSGERVAVKVEKAAYSHLLGPELKILREVQGLTGIPALIGYGQTRENVFIVMELLGPTLAFYFRKRGRFSLETVLKIADQVLPILEELHTKGFVHRDIKPSNFLLDLVGESIHIIDFGLSQRISRPSVVPQRKRHAPALVGTLPFLSLGCHLGGEYSCKDDLEACLYMLLYFYNGSLPWTGKKTDSVSARRLKAHISPSALCAGLPPAFSQVLSYIRSISAAESIDYSFARRKFAECASECAVGMDFCYDWSEELTGSCVETGDSQEGGEERFLGWRKQREATIRREFNPRIETKVPLELRQSFEIAEEAPVSSRPHSGDCPSALESCLLF